MFRDSAHREILRHISRVHPHEDRLMCNYGLKCRMTFTGIDALTQHVEFTHRKKDRRKPLVSINTSLVNGCKCVQRIMEMKVERRQKKANLQLKINLPIFSNFLAKPKAPRRKEIVCCNFKFKSFVTVTMRIFQNVLKVV